MVSKPQQTSRVDIDKKQGLPKDQILIKQAYSAFYAHDWQKAEQLFAEAKSYNSNNLNAWIGYAISNAKQQKLVPALEAYQQVLLISPKNRYAVEGIANIMQNFPAQSEKWLDAIQDVLQDYPDSSILNYSMGGFLASRQDWQGAQEYYFKALAQQPSNALYNLNMAISLDQLKQYSIAADYYSKALVFKNEQTPFDENAVKKRLAALKLYLQKGQD